MKILLLGSKGQLGTDFQKVIDAKILKAVDYPEVDVTDKASVEKLIEQVKPEIVINTSAYNRVDDAEEKWQEALAVNLGGVKNLCDACEKQNCVLVHFSTDYVFGADSTRKEPYSEQDRPGPVNMYGVSKLAGEYALQYRLQKYFLIRTSGLFGTAGSLGKGGNFVETMIRLGKEKGKVKVVSDQVLTPTYTLDLARNTFELIKTKSFGLYHATSQGQCSWYEFARKIFELLNLSVECIPCASAEFPSAARRPAYSVLENRRLKELGLDRMQDWEAALRGYLQEKGYLG